jgi:hypothetical protein
MSPIEHPERDDTAVKVAEALWPQRYMGDLTTAEWARCYAVVDAANDQLRGAVSLLAELGQCANTHDVFPVDTTVSVHVPLRLLRAARSTTLGGQ